MGRLRTIGSEPAVEGDRDDPQGKEFQQQRRQHGPPARRSERHPQQRDHGRGSDDRRRDESPGTWREDHDERAQVDRQRPDPQQGCGDQIRGDEGRHRQEQPRWDRGEEDPAEPSGSVDGASGRGDGIHRRGEGLRPVDDRRGCARRGDGQQRHHQDVGDQPHTALTRQPQARFDDERVCQQRQQRPAVTERVEPVRIIAIVGADVGDPAGQQGRGARQHEGRETDDGSQQDDDAHGGGQTIDPDRGQTSGGQEQGHDPEAGERNMDRRSPSPEPGHRDVGIEIPAEQDGLEEEQGRRPDRRCPAEDRQHQAANERLHREQQERRQADGGGERDHSGGHEEPPRAREATLLAGSYSWGQRAPAANASAPIAIPTHDPRYE